MKIGVKQPKPRIVIRLTREEGEKLKDILHNREDDFSSELWDKLYDAVEAVRE